MSKASNYYYEQLNKEQQKAYYAMKEGLLNQQDSFAVPMLDKKELSDIYFMVRMDCPEIFYSVRFSYRYYPDSTAVAQIHQPVQQTGFFCLQANDGQLFHFNDCHWTSQPFRQ